MGWLSRWFPKRLYQPKPRKYLRSFRPQFEILEDRQLLTLAAPTLLSPIGWSSPTPTFSWSSVAGAASYNFQLTNLNSGVSVSGTGLMQTSIILGAPLLLGDHYQWFVNDLDGSGNISTTNSVTIVVTNLTAPTLIGPSGPSVPEPQFSWQPLSAAVAYNISIVNKNTGATVINQQVTGATTFTPSTPLAQGYTYTWMLQGVDSSGTTGPWSDSLTFTESVLPPPTLIGPSSTALGLQPQFSWNAVSGADHYDVYLQDQKTGEVIRNTDVPGTTWSPTSSLADQDSYTWWVRAVDPSGYNGQWSSSLTFTDYALPAPGSIGPTGLSVPVPAFSWNAVTGADHYDIWVQDMKTSQVTRDTDVSGTTWSPSSTLTIGDNYEWWVRAIDPTGNVGEWSNGNTFSVYALPAPTLTSPNGTSMTIPTFTWSAVSGVDHYDVWVQDMKTGTVLRDQNDTTNSWTPAAPLTQGDTYTWWVRAFTAANQASPWSAPLTLTVAQLMAPALLSPTGTSSNPPTFSWNTVTGADHYDVYVQDMKIGTVLRNQNVSTNSWTPSSPLKLGDTYEWWVRAMDSVNSPGPWSTWLSFTPYALPAPTLTSPAGTSSTLPTFNWSAVSGVDHYDVWVQDMKTGTVLRDQNDTTNSWTPAAPLTQGDTYTWWVRALTAANQASPWSAPLTLTVAQLMAPALLSPTGTSSNPPTFSWNTVTGADHYDVYVQDMKTGTVLRNQNVSTNSWTPSSPLTLGDTYEWWVRAMDSVNSPGPWSTWLSFTPYALPAPTLTSPAGTSSTLPTFNWSAVSGVDHYDVWVQDMKTGTVLRGQNDTTNSWTPAAPLTQGDTYTWWVRALTAANQASPWSAPLTLTVAQLAAPALLSPIGTSSNPPTFSWNTVTGADHYDVYVQDMKTGTVVRDQNVTGLTWTPSSPLKTGDTYEWWVRAVDAVNSPGPWSSFLTITV